VEVIAFPRSILLARVSSPETSLFEKVLKTVSFVSEIAKAQV
jgi:hypothetical protein